MSVFMAPQVGLEPTTLRLTAECSAIELLRHIPAKRITPQDFGIRQRPSLPGGFPPSTLSVLRLNYCVRDGNRWDPQAIVTGNCIRLCSLQDSLRPPLSLPARSPLPAPFLFLRRLSLSASIRVASSFASTPLLFLPLPHLQNCTGAQALALASPTLDRVPALRNRFFSLLRSSPRPISIIKLHTLPHFHR